jgi:L-asparaginase II
MSDVELVHVVRGGVLDCVHRGRVVIVDAAGDILYAAGDPDAVVYLRSCAKPFQALAAVRSGAAARYGFGSEQLAIMAGSHNGTPPQTRLVDDMLAAIGAETEDLQCGTGAPLNREAYEQLLMSGARPSVLQHNCSGKHTGMLATCRVMGWRMDNYRSPDHPLQLMIRGIIADCAGMSADDIVIAIDGCGVPTFGLPLKNIARMFAALGAAANDESSDLGMIARAMQQHPYVFSGKNRIDTSLVVASNNRLIAKDGAEALLGVSVPEQGVGIALKISDGNNRAQIPALSALLVSRGYITADERAALEDLMPSTITIHTGQEAGEYRSVLPI